MRKVFLSILLLTSLFIKAQQAPPGFVPNYANTAFRALSGYGLFGMPQDTFAIPTADRMLRWSAYHGDTTYIWSVLQQKWIISSGGTPTLSVLTIASPLTGGSYNGLAPISIGIDTNIIHTSAYNDGRYSTGIGNTIYTGDGTIDGERHIEINSLFEINHNGADMLHLDPTAGNEEAEINAHNFTGDGNIARAFMATTNTDGTATLSTRFNDGNSAQIRIRSNTDGATAEYTADTHTFNGNVLVSTLNTGGSAPATSGTRQYVISDANGLLSFTNKTFSALTFGATTTWDYTTGPNKTLRLTGDANLVLPNVQDGDDGTLIVIQDGSGGHSLTVPDQIITLNSAAGDTTVLGWINQAGVYYWATSVGGGGQTLTISSPLTGTSYDGSAPVSIGIQNAAADGSTKGAASFNATYFDASSGVVNIDLTNGAASASQGGYVTTGTQTIAGSKTFSGTTTIATPFTLGAVSVASTGTQLNYLNAATGTTGTTSSNLVFSASPTFTGTVTIPSPFTLGATSVTTTGAKLNFLTSAAGTTGTTSTNVVFSTSPTLVTPTLGAATATSINGNTFTTGTYTLTGVAGKTLTFNKSITLEGTDATTMTFPTTSATIARTDAAQTFTGVQTFSSAPVISSITNTGTFTIPTVTGTAMQYAEATTASNATWAPAGDARVNWYQLTAQAAAVTTISAPSGTPANHNLLYIRVKDNATVRAISGWDAIYRAGTDLPFPTTTTLSKTMYIVFCYNSLDTKWDLVDVVNGLSMVSNLLLSIVFGGLITFMEKRKRILRIAACISLLLLPFKVPFAATRFYFDRLNTSPLSPAINAGWTKTTVAAYCMAYAGKVRFGRNASQGTQSSIASGTTAPQKMVGPVYITQPLAAQTILSGATFTFQLRCSKNATASTGNVWVYVRLCNDDGTNITEIGNCTNTANALTTTGTNRNLVLTLGGNITVADNQRIIFEIGENFTTGTTSHAFSFFSSIAPGVGDHTLGDNTETSAFNSWCECSQTLTMAKIGNF